MFSPFTKLRFQRLPRRIPLHKHVHSHMQNGSHYSNMGSSATIGNASTVMSFGTRYSIMCSVIAYPSQGKNLRGKKNSLAGVPDNRCNSSARIRMKCMIVPSWPLPGTSFQVNITTLANSDFPLPSGGNCC